eukprot:CAMPEP_0175041450 /NCGR_PEP_ID=MMETSP0052_2-20121109/1922_1 /TAXON_ID=51329 ORGANISM="Polytomella parva, Strain SAG 63-3" /NCGR_SAMPLE_ID=MMETSP0052_2 /ASSEMBLY_ACC=CAM_ASM_000194 /LENGTH=441 /DNA_ID=CAMNT_0016303967 /DNA_START=914 /DNA_END=2236 /DNA_ORIENTATION=+
MERVSLDLDLILRNKRFGRQQQEGRQLEELERTISEVIGRQGKEGIRVNGSIFETPPQLLLRLLSRLSSLLQLLTSPIGSSCAVHSFFCCSFLGRLALQIMSRSLIEVSVLFLGSSEVDSKFSLSVQKIGFSDDRPNKHDSGWRGYRKRKREKDRVGVERISEDEREALMMIVRQHYHPPRRGKGRERGECERGEREGFGREWEKRVESGRPKDFNRASSSERRAKRLGVESGRVCKRREMKLGRGKEGGVRGAKRGKGREEARTEMSDHVVLFNQISDGLVQDWYDTINCLIKTLRNVVICAPPHIASRLLPPATSPSSPVGRHPWIAFLWMFEAPIFPRYLRQSSLSLLRLLSAPSSPRAPLSNENVGLWIIADSCVEVLRNVRQCTDAIEVYGRSEGKEEGENEAMTGKVDVRQERDRLLKSWEEKVIAALKMHVYPD